MTLVRPAPQENPFRQFSWLGPIVGALVVSAIISFVSSPVSKLDNLEKRIQAMEISKAALDVQVAGLKDQLTEIKSSQIVLATKLDGLRGDVQQLAAIAAAQSAARR